MSLLPSLDEAICWASLIYLVTGNLESTTVLITGSRSDPAKTNRAYGTIEGCVVIVKLFYPPARAFPIPAPHRTTGCAFVVEKHPSDCNCEQHARCYNQWPSADRLHNYAVLVPPNV